VPATKLNVFFWKVDKRCSFKQKLGYLHNANNPLIPTKSQLWHGEHGNSKNTALNSKKAVFLYLCCFF